MLSLLIKGGELYDESKNEFVVSKDQTIVLEHSLVSISKWESRWKRPFFSKDRKSIEESRDYIKCMTITQNVQDDVYIRMSDSDMQKVNDYIDDSMTATTFAKSDSDSKSIEIITSEIIYYWMVTLDIPMECQKWHINRLLTLIQVCNVKNQKPKKMSRRDLASRNKRLNEERRKAMQTKG